MWEAQLFGFEFYFLFYNFFLYSFCGWIYESCLVSFEQKTWVNRGFLNGPVVPIYGAGATIVYMWLYRLEEEPVLIFLLGMAVATTIEYVTSYVMEKLFHTKWWDYSNHKYNFQGRICLVASFFWGFLSLLMMDVLQPFMNTVIAKIPRREGEIAGYFILVIFTADLAVTVIYTLQLDKKLAEVVKSKEEFMEYLAGTRLYATKEELLEKMKGLSARSMAESLKGRLDGLDEMKDEVMEKTQGFLQLYEKKTQLQNSIERRLVRAFPTMKSTRNDDIVTEIRKHRKEEHKKR